MPEATIERLDRADAGARAVPLPDPRHLPPARRTSSTTRASGCCRSPASFNDAPRDDLPGAEHVGHQVPDVCARRRQRRRPRRRATTPRCSRATATRPSAAGRRRRTSAPTARPRTPTRAIYNGMLQRDWFLAQARNFDDHARCRARRQRDPARRRRDAGRRDARRHGAVPALRAAAPEAARAAELPPRTTASMPIYRSDKTYPYEEARDLALRLGGAARRRLRRQVQALRLRRPDRRLRERRQAQRRLQRRRLRRRPVPADELQRHARRGVHARPRGRPRDAHGAVVRERSRSSRPTTRSSSPRSRRRSTSASCSTSCCKQTTDPKERFLLLQHAVDSIVGTFYTQVLFADFELRAHRLVEKGEPLTTEVLNKLYAGLLKEYWGDAVTIDDFYKYTWARIPHFFNSPYYVYQYATCFASSAQLYDGDDDRRARVAQGGDRALPDAAEERRQRPPDDAAQEGRRRPDPARDDPGGDRPDGPAGRADGGRGGEDPLNRDLRQPSAPRRAGLPPRRRPPAAAAPAPARYQPSPTCSGM